MMKIFQLKISKLFYRKFLEELQLHLSSQEIIEWGVNCKLIFTPNPEMCLKTLEDEEFLRVLQSADYLTSDGLGLYLAYQMIPHLWISSPLKERRTISILEKLFSVVSFSSKGERIQDRGIMWRLNIVLCNKRKSIDIFFFWEFFKVTSLKLVSKTLLHLLKILLKIFFLKRLYSRIMQETQKYRDFFLG